MSEEIVRRSVVESIKQSSPIDLSEPYDPSWVAGKTILITGGASGFGEGFFRKWAQHGANVIIGDVNSVRGAALVEEVRRETGSRNHHFLKCDVADWQSQVEFFREACKLSLSGGIDAVVANAGIPDFPSVLENPEGLDADAPPKPDLKCFDVDLIGVLYTAHLAWFYLPRNPRSQNVNLSAHPSAHTPG